MRHFRFLRGRARGDATSRPATEAREWAHAGVADEVEAYLAGRYVELMVARKRPVPAWAVVNRLAHATRDELGRVVEGTTMSRGSPPSRRVAWEESERFLAGGVEQAVRHADGRVLRQHPAQFRFEAGCPFREGLAEGLGVGAGGEGG